MITHFVHQSVDGFIEGPNGEFDWPLMGPELSAYSHELTESADVFLYGRKVWEMMSWFWPKAEEMSQDPHDLRFAPIWRKYPKVVVSRTLTEAGWNAEVVRSPEELPDKNMVLFGGSALAAALTERNMIDEYQVFVHPVALGGGKPTFPDPVKLDLVETRTLDGQVVLLKYRR